MYHNQCQKRSKSHENNQASSSVSSAAAERLASTPLMQRRELEREELFEPMQRMPNHTGLPDNLKDGMENLSGFSLDHVKVHYNSDKPATVQAHAYAQGSNIYLGAGQEKHLPHELGHVVQQMQGRVQPTTSVDGVAVNDNPALEHEATQMGEMALRGG